MNNRAITAKDAKIGPTGAATPKTRHRQHPKALPGEAGRTLIRRTRAEHAHQLCVEYRQPESQGFALPHHVTETLEKSSCLFL